MKSVVGWDQKKTNEITLNNISSEDMSDELNMFYARFDENDYSAELQHVAHRLSSSDKSEIIEFRLRLRFLKL